MTPDSLDDLLDRSAPATCAIDDRALTAMIADARHEVPRGRKRRGALLAGSLAVVLIGGAGFATADSDWLWGAGMDDPRRSVTYTSPTWGACELRLGELRAANPLAQAGIDQVIDAWFAETDIESEMAPLIGKYLAVLEDSQAGDPESLADPRLPDLNYWGAVDQSVAELLHDELTEHGYTGPGAGLASGASQVHCEGEQWR